ncbi:MAG: hypothetical protein LBE91_06400 [Tannerella sp.]|jgi:hypothetical protein|nr:hypothetical protein [Tannerella sp.]
MKTFLLILWQLPQWIVSLLVCGYYVMTDKLVDIYTVESKYGRSEAWIVDKESLSAVSFGRYIFAGKKLVEKFGTADLKHEYGHSVQSLWLGPLYLVVIGLPSLLFTAFDGNIARRTYPEIWADRIAEGLEIRIE